MSRTDTPTDDDSLRDLIAEENGREDTSIELVERAVELIDVSATEVSDS